MFSILKTGTTRPDVASIYIFTMHSVLFCIIILQQTFAPLLFHR